MFSSVCDAIASKLVANAQSVSVAESSTGGLIAANLLSVAGASSYFRGGSVSTPANRDTPFSTLM